VKYLLDVNALIALKHARSPHHQTCRSWVIKQGIESLATCALTELSFIRVSMAAFGVSLPDAQKDLAELKTKIRGFVEKNPSPILPPWSTHAGQTTDAYLLQLAKSAALDLATFDTGIPGAVLIK
jgi:predicted nucleic acid-binding protein